MHPFRSPLLSSVDNDELARHGALLDGLFSGDPLARTRFFDAFQQTVNRLVWALLGADAAHDDIVHDAFARMFAQVSKVRAAHALPGWVKTVTVNTVRLELRKRRWKRLFTTEREALQLPDVRVSDASERERVRRLYRVLGRMSAQDRVVLVLRYLEGYELTEVAQLTNCSLATVKRHLAKAEMKFKMEFEGTGFEGTELEGGHV